ncbi:MAG: serine hydrolase domain-containing protein [Acidobacteriota bacterium]
MWTESVGRLKKLGNSFVTYDGIIEMKWKSTLILPTLILALASTYVHADKLTNKVDVYVKAQMEKSHIPGVSLAVVRDGKVVLAKGYGLANVELSVPATRDTVYELLSVSKEFTAAAILLLVEEEKVSLGETVPKYLPDSPAAWKDITVRHLLSHTSGITDYTDIRPFFEMIRQDASPEELMKPVKERPLDFAAGTRWRYSNSNYFVLGLILEKVSGKKYADFLEERIFQPLGMMATRVNDMTDIITNRASGYHWLGEDHDKMPPFVSGYHGRKNVLQNAIYISPTRKWAAGAILSSVTDLIKWDAALQTGKLLKKSTVEQMSTPTKLKSGVETDYGLGNELSEARGHRLAGHQGGGMAFNTTLLRCVDDNLTVIVLTNQTSGPSKPMAIHIASLFVPGLSYEQGKGIEDKDPKITELLRGVLVDAQKGKADASLFAPEALQTADFIRRAGPNFLGTKGALKSFVPLERREEAARRVLIYRSVFGETSILWTFALDKEDKILSLTPKEE